MKGISPNIATLRVVRQINSNDLIVTDLIVTVSELLVVFFIVVVVLVLYDKHCQYCMQFDKKRK